MYKIKKNNTRILSLIINRVRFKKKKKTPTQKKRKSLAFIDGGNLNFYGKLSFTLSFLSSLAPHTVAAAYIFTAPTCKATTTISLEPCALNADFQHFIPG
jgi:hypothetical protein